MNASFDLSSKVAVVTGGNSGIGLGMAQGLASAGCRVVIWGRSSEANDAAVQILEALGAKAASGVVDVADEAAVDAAMFEAVDRYGRVDAVLAAAGVAPAPKPFVDQTQADWRDAIAINILGTAQTLRAGLRHMIERQDRGQGGGSLIAVASLSARSGAPRMQPYAASKAAIVSLIQDLAVEAGRYGVRANAVLPGWTSTRLTQALQDDPRLAAMIENRVPLGRWAFPSDYGALAVYLAGDGSRFHTGDTFVLDGGFSLT